jgi:DNA-directed RNA polymerase subunit M/transcription elongation factor TFIIS
MERPITSNMENMINNAEDMEIDSSEINYEPQEEVDEICPECKSNRMVKYYRNEFNWNYTTVYECLGCGAVWED